MTASVLVALTLTVPFLPQTPALCGGAAVAMVFRYWGDRHADVQQFASLVDRRAGGIANHVLVQAVRDRQWRAVPLAGSIDLLRSRLAAGEPLILLLEERRNRYHYVVAVGAEDDAVVVHDPTWGPRRRYPLADLTRRWAKARFWALLIQPPAPPGQMPSSAPQSTTSAAPSPAAAGTVATTRCDRLLDAALDDIAARGLGSADETLSGVLGECPDSAAAAAELAGVRFAAKNWRGAEALAEQAVALDPANTYAWDVLASSRFVQDDLAGALSAWNRAGRPQLDSVVIDGLARTRYALVAEVSSLSPNTTLTASAYRLAERRLAALPSQQALRIGYKTDADGFATVHVAIAERAAHPTRPLVWAAIGARAAVTREVRAAIPGWTGQGEVWNGSWRWWNGRPRVTVDFAAPRVGPLPGISSVHLSWDRQTYAAGGESVFAEQRVHGSFANTDWATPDFRYELRIGFDSWNRIGRTTSFGGGVEQRLLNDRVALDARAQYFVSLENAPGFSTSSFSAGYRSRTAERGLVHVVSGGLDRASTHAPLALWSGAGDTDVRAHLLRAHPLLADGVIRGEVFGRNVSFLNAESQAWMRPLPFARVGFAAFVDVAGASHRIKGTARVTRTDAGAGIRLRLPGIDGLVRADYAHGIGDGGYRFSVGLVADRFSGSIRSSDRP